MVDSHTYIENEQLILDVKPLLELDLTSFRYLEFDNNISNLELTRNTSDKLEITQMFFIANSTIWINLNDQLLQIIVFLVYFPHLKCVIVSCRVFEQSIVRVEHLLRQEIEPLPRNTTVVKADLQRENKNVGQVL